MIMDRGNILAWLKTFFIHGDFEYVPDDFDISDEIAKSGTKRIKLKVKERKDTDSQGGGTRPPTDTTVSALPESEDPFLDGVYPFKNDELLELIPGALEEIHAFNTELDISVEQLEDKFNKNEYQYDTASKH
jgi:hypothetical protein